MCVRFGMQSRNDSTVPAHFKFHTFNMQPRWRNLLQTGISVLRVSELRDTELSNTPRRSQRLASQRECEARCHEQESSERRYASLPHILTPAITACIIIDMAIPLTMHAELTGLLQELHPYNYSHPSCEAPCVLRMP